VTGLQMENGSDAFQSGRNLGYGTSVLVGAIETAVGLAGLISSLSSIKTTGGGTLACVAATAGVGSPPCLTIGALAIAGEGALAVASAGLAAHGSLVAFTAEPPTKSSTPEASSGDPYVTARSGGRHSGAYDNYKSRSTPEVRNALEGYEAQVREHQAKVENPRNYVPDWDRLSAERQHWYVQGWTDDIQRNGELRDIMRGILAERGATP